MTVNIVGIDCATEDKNMGVACARLAGRAIDILDVRVGDRAGSVLQQLVDSCASGEPTILALDAPLGWPAALGPALVSHRAGGRIPGEANTLFRRRTDAYIKDKLDRQSLDVGADRIARTAHSALRLLNDLAERLSTQIPLAWGPQIGRLAAIEVYPAATLAGYGIPARAYKDADAEPARRAIVQRLEHLVSMRCASEILLRDADALDSVVCALAGADFLRGEAQPPDDPTLAAKEGWIWSRLRSPASGQLTDAVGRAGSRRARPGR